MADRTPILSRETLVPAGVVVALVLTAAGAGAAWKEQFAAIDRSFEIVNERLTAIEAGVGQHWSERDMREWAKELGLRNPALSVPTPDGGW